MKIGLQAPLNLPHNAPSARIILLLLLLTAIRGGNFVAMKVSLQGLTPLLAAGLRNGIGSIALVGFAVAMRRELVKYSRLQVAGMAALGILLALNFAIVYVGLTKTTASRAAILLNAQPLFVAVLSKFFISSERIGFRRIAGMGLAFLGVLVVFADKASSFGFQTLWGDAMMFLAATIWAVLAIMRKRIAQKVEPIAVATWENWVSTLLMLPVGVGVEGLETVNLTLPVTVGLLYCAFLGSAFTFATNVYLLKNYDINAISSFNFLIPVAGATLSIFILGDIVTPQLILGTLLVAVGLYLVNSTRTTGGQSRDEG